MHLSARLIYLFMCGLLLSACQPHSSFVPHRPSDPWIIRSVLDQQIRMVTLALHSEGYVAYHTENCALYKVWKGGVHWDGAAFNNVKIVQPESWGIPYIEHPKNNQPWKVIIAGDTIRAAPIYKGYRLINDQIRFEYQISRAEEEPMIIYEMPEIISLQNGKVVFSRTFETLNIPKDVEIWNGGLQLPFNESESFSLPFDPILSIPEELSQRNTSSSVSQYWLDRSGCTTCHEPFEKTIGPSYASIAAKYDDHEETMAYLVQKVQQGGSGVWGNVPMNAHPHLPKKDIQKMVSFILSYKPEDNVLVEKAVAQEKVKKKKVGQDIAKEASALSIQKAISERPGFGTSLIDVHPMLSVQTIHPASFRPRVGAMDFLSDGRLLVATWDSVGGVFALEGVETGDTSQISIRRIASGLAEPLGLKVVEGEIYVLQKQELTQLIDHDADGKIDEYRNICNSWGATADFHEFSYGLEFQDGFFYANLGLGMRLMSHELQHSDRGTTLKISPEGSFTRMITGLRQANGIGRGPEGELFITENQGQWVPACKVIHVQEGDFHGCHFGMGDRYEGRKMENPAVWLPQDEIGNSPGQPVMIPFGPYKGQMLHGEITHGGLKRVYMEKVAGKYQGAVFRFSQGLEAGIVRAVWGPDSALYVGGVGMNGSWSWKEKQYGLQRLAFTGEVPFELLRMSATPTGFELTFTEPLADGHGESTQDYTFQQWRYEATAEYGGPKLDLCSLYPRSIQLSADRTQVSINIPGLTEGHVVYLLLNEGLKSESGRSLWSGETWYTLNHIPSDNFLSMD